jgi:hypothetical protein
MSYVVDVLLLIPLRDEEQLNELLDVAVCRSVS